MWRMTSSEELYRQALEQITNTVRVRREAARSFAKQEPTDKNITIAHTYREMDLLVRGVLSDLVQILDAQSEGVNDHTKSYWMLVPPEENEDDQ